MRLTLRTLLAYLDNVLEPADAELLGAKVRDSEFATGLVQRIQSILHRPRIGAPKLNSKGLALDANHVAEYLDGSLPAERVGDFERVCLESDMSLAEAAACHQILTLVLGKPADVPAGLRERIYAFDLEPSVAVASAVSAVAKPAGAAVTSHSPKAETPPAPPKTAVVPDYLRSGRSRSRVLPFVATLAGAFLIAAVGLWAMGPLDQRHPLMRLFGLGPAVVAEAPDAEPSPDETVTSETAELAAVTEPVAPLESTTPPVEVTAPNETPRLDNALTKGPMPVPVTEPPSDAQPPTELPDAKAVTRPLPLDQEPERRPGSVPPPLPLEPAPIPMEEMPPKPLAATTVPVPSEPAPVPPEPTTPPATPMPVEATESADVGRYVSDAHILGRYDGRQRIWVRMPPRALLVAGEQLVALPTYRPQLALASGVQVTLVGEASVRLDPPRGNASAMTVDFGRLTIDTVGAPGSKIDLDLGGVKGTAILSDADSSLAIDTRNYLPPGANPENVDEPAIPIVELFVGRGRVTWQVPDQPAVEIPAGSVLTYIDLESHGLEGPIRAPEWIDPRSATSLDRETSLGMEPLVALDKPLNISLQELLQDRRVDFRALAARSLGVLDQFEPLIQQLNDDRQKSFWAAEIDTLKSSLARSPETAAAMRGAIERLRPKDARTIYRLIWGYSPEQLASGEAEQLVKFLEHPELDIRVLTFDNLRRITGVLLLYRPERKADQNKLAITKWKEKLKVGEIAYVAPPSPFSNRQPLDSPAAPERSRPVRPPMPVMPEVPQAVE